MTGSNTIKIVFSKIIIDNFHIQKRQHKHSHLSLQMSVIPASEWSTKNIDTYSPHFPEKFKVWRLSPQRISNVCLSKWGHSCDADFWGPSTHCTNYDPWETVHSFICFDLLRTETDEISSFLNIAGASTEALVTPALSSYEAPQTRTHTHIYTHFNLGAN